jgi:hypothetical protein
MSFIEVPLWVLNPRDKNESFIRITDIEPGSELAQAVVSRELAWLKELIPSKRRSYRNRVRKIAEYLQVETR